MLPKLISVQRFEDERGWMSEIYNTTRLASVGITDIFVQDNHSYSVSRGTLRGLHFQTSPHSQSKLVRCIAGAVWDVAVDLRLESPTRGRWIAAELSATNGYQLYIPIGFAHGFVTLTDETHVLYKCNANYAPHAEGSIRWDDPQVAIEWPLNGFPPILSSRDTNAPSFADLTVQYSYDGDPLGVLEEVTV